MDGTQPTPLLTLDALFSAMLSLLHLQFPTLSISRQAYQQGPHLQLSLVRGKVRRQPNDPRVSQRLELSLHLSDSQPDPQQPELIAQLASMVSEQHWGWPQQTVGRARRIRYRPRTEAGRQGWQLRWRQTVRFGAVPTDASLGLDDLLIALNPSDPDDLASYQPLESLCSTPLPD